MASDRSATSAQPNDIKAFTAPAWMKRGEKRLFFELLNVRLDAKEQPSAAEIDRIADYIASRGRISTLREILREEEAEFAGGSQFTSTKSRILQIARQLDAAEKQSHRLASDLGLL